MSWLLDTNACIRYLNGRAPNLKARLDSADEASIYIFSVVKAELFYGAQKSLKPEVTLRKQQLFVSRFSSLPFDDRAADAYGRIRAGLETQGIPIGPNDLLIASIAVANNMILVSRNVDEFRRVPGLSVEDWESAS